MEVHEVKLVWTDPRTGVEYEIHSTQSLDDEAPWPGYVYLVTNHRTGERASFHYKDLDGVQQSLGKLVDVAERLIAGRAENRGRGRRWGRGRRVLGRVVERAMDFAWGARSDLQPPASVDDQGRSLEWEGGRSAGSEPRATSPSN